MCKVVRVSADRRVARVIPAGIFLNRKVLTLLQQEPWSMLEASWDDMYCAGPDDEQADLSPFLERAYDDPLSDTELAILSQEVDERERVQNKLNEEHEQERVRAEEISRDRSRSPSRRASSGSSSNTQTVHQLAQWRSSRKKQTS